jgi:hypothetical protein
MKFLFCISAGCLFDRFFYKTVIFNCKFIKFKKEGHTRILEFSILAKKSKFPFQRLEKKIRLNDLFSGW